MPLGREVDLAREERIRKCDACVEQFEKFSKSKGYQKALQREGETVYDAAHLVKNHLENLMNATRATKAEPE